MEERREPRTGVEELLSSIFSSSVDDYGFLGLQQVLWWILSFTLTRIDFI